MEQLRERVVEKDQTNVWPQLLVLIAVCMGAFSFGTVLGWGSPALHQLKQFEYGEKYLEYYYNWSVSLGPLGAALGIMPWNFLMRHFGPKTIMLLQIPVLLLLWFLTAYYDTYKTYCTAHFFIAFFSVAYIHVGETFLIETVHKTLLKDMYVYFKCSVLMGVICMNCIGSMFSKWHLCMICASVPTMCSVLLAFLPESPVYLLQYQDSTAEKALRFYRGKSAQLSVELQVMRKYMLFLSFGYNAEQLLGAAVVKKAMRIVAVLHVVKVLSGYYAFLLDAVQIFTYSTSIINPFVDNVVFSVSALLMCVIGAQVHVQMMMGVKWPLIVSMVLIAVTLGALGGVSIADRELGLHNERLLRLATLCVFTAAYELGVHMAPDILLFSYSPHQVYDRVRARMAALDWALVFVTLWVFMLCKSRLMFGVAVLVYAAVAVAGAAFAAAYVVEPRGLSLQALQLRLGGNPAGLRGSWRRRMPHPLEDFAMEEDAQRRLLRR